MAEISIVIPAHNEEENVEPLIESLLQLKLPDSEIIIVDDTSTDRTGKIADTLAKTHRCVKAMHRKGSPGMGNALRDGTKAAKGNIVVWVMGDRSDDLTTIPKMLHQIRKGADLVTGSRYIHGGSRGNLSIGKAILSFGYTFTTRILFQMPLHDITNAFRAFRKIVFVKCNPKSGDFAISPEFAILANKRGFRLAEVPTVYINRLAGRPKFKMFKMGIRYSKLLLGLLFK